MVGQVDDPVGAAGQRRGVAGKVVFVVADADHQGAAEPGGHNHAGPVAEDHGQAIRALELGESGLHRGHQRRVGVGARIGILRQVRQLVSRQMGDHLAIGGAGELVAGVDQALLERAKIFDDAVMDQRHGAAAAEVGMGVFVGRRAVGSPAGVADAERAAHRAAAKEGGQVVDAAGRFGDVKLAVVERGDAGAVVAAVLKLPQARQQEVGRLLMTDVTDDSAHREPRGRGGVPC